MNIFQKIFKQKKAFVAYITAGHGGEHYTQQAALALIDGGVDILEIGVPFSDPIADGPTIQHAMNQALDTGITLNSIFKTVTHIKTQTQTPIVVFTYYNPLLAMGLDQALKTAALAGVDGMLVVDLPIEESNAYFKACKQYNIEPICLISPTTSAERIATINQNCDSFLYYVCRNGTTGIKSDLPLDYAQKLATIKANTTQPVVSGFGISDRQLSAQALEHADGFVVGSAFVKAITDGASPADLKTLTMNIDPR